MKNQITLSQWNELSIDGKEKLRSWAMNHKYELDLIPKESDDFSLSCDYVILLTTEQMIAYLQEEKYLSLDSNKAKIDELWKQTKSLVEETTAKNN